MADDLIAELGALSADRRKKKRRPNGRDLSTLIVVAPPEDESEEEKGDVRAERRISSLDPKDQPGARAGREQVNPALSAQEQFLSGLSSEEQEIVRKFQALGSKD